MTQPTATRHTAATDICLYGNRDTGAGFLGVTSHGIRFGDGAPKADRSFTEACWQAIEEARRLGAIGLVRIFDAGGERCAVIDIDVFLLSYANLKWNAAPVLTLSGAALIAAAAAEPYCAACAQHRPCSCDDMTADRAAEAR